VDVLTLLKTDHQIVAGMLDEAKKCEPGDARLFEIAKEIEKALTVHASIEEQLFYPQLHERAEKQEARIDVFEAYTEHDVLKHLIALLQSGGQPDEQFKAELEVLGENVKHHVKEEEWTIFGLARKLMSRDELEELGEEMERLKVRLMAEPSAGTTRGGSKKSASKSTAPKSTASLPGRKTSAKATTVRKAPAKVTTVRKAPAKASTGRKRR
jgi:hemerythrin-like domain-containing protein